jgi:hypothetical protein
MTVHGIAIDAANDDSEASMNHFLIAPAHVAHHLDG